MFVWNMNDEVFRANSMDEIKGGRMSMEEDVITNEFGDGNMEFLCCAGGYCAPSVQAIIHADSIAEAIKLRDEYYSNRIKARNIIFEPLYTIVS